MPLKILFLAFELPGGFSNGLSLRIHNIARHFDSRKFEPYLLVVNPLDLDVTLLRNIYAGVQFIRMEPPKRGGFRKIYDALTFSRSWINFSFPELGSVVSHWTNYWKIDCVVDVAGNLVASLPVGSIPIPVACDLIDAPTLAIRRRLKQSTDPVEFARLAYELLRQHIYQRKSFSSALFISVVAELDAEEIRASLPAMEVLVVPNGVDTDYYHPSTAKERRFDIVFEGNLSFIPNVDAAMYLVNTILPIIQAIRPGVRVALIGKDPSPGALALASESVIVTGTVDDVRPWVQSGAVFACPMRFGAGIKNKILQALSMGMPIVCTSETIPGLAVVDGVHLLVRDSPEAFAAAVLALMDDCELAGKLGRTGRQHVVESFSWVTQSEKFGAALRNMTPPGRHLNRSIFNFES